MLAICLTVSVVAVSASAAGANDSVFAGANLNLNEGIAIQFLAYPEAVEEYDSSYLSVKYRDRDETLLTKEIEGVEYTFNGKGYILYRFDAVSPDRMADVVNATLYGVKGGNDTQIGDTITYSVKQYVTNTYANTTDTKLKTLLADILYYGEKARFYTGTNNTSLISDCSWVDTCKSDAVDMADISSVKNLTDFTNAHVEWTSVGLNLRENPAILYKFKLTNKASGVSNYKLVVEVEGEKKLEYQLSAADYNKSERCYVYRFRGLNPTKMGETVTAYFVNAQGEKVSATLDYSVESFAKFCYDQTNGGTAFTSTVTEELYELIEALLAYGKSAKAYFDGVDLPVDSVTYYIAENTDSFHVTGRTDVVAGSDITNQKDGLLYDHAAQGLLFNAYCEGDITISLALNMRSSDTDGLHYYTVYIDGVKQNRVTATGTPGSTVLTEMKVATGLECGLHTIEVYRNHEALIGTATLVSVTMKGVPQKWVEDEDQLKIEFIGDSITSGTGVYGTNGASDQSNIRYYDGTATYAFVASRLLNAEASIVSRSGMCCAGDDTVNMYKYYDDLSYERYSTIYDNYDHSKMDVDLYVISLGTNDTNSNHSYTDEQLSNNVKTALATVREDHPNAKILWVYGQLTNTRASVIEQAVEEAGGEAEGFYYYCCKTPNSSGGTYHPNAEAQQRDGEEVAAYIKTILGLE